MLECNAASGYKSGGKVRTKEEEKAEQQELQSLIHSSQANKQLQRFFLLVRLLRLTAPSPQFYFHPGFLFHERTVLPLLTFLYRYFFPTVLCESGSSSP